MNKSTMKQTPETDLDHFMPLSPNEFSSQLNLSADIFDKFSAYQALLEKWQRRINLVSNTTLPDLWRRHFLDCAQLAPLIPDHTKTLVDLGSGAGFPGLVLALLLPSENRPDIHLIEADSRKATFLSEANRILETSVTIHARRIESVIDLKAGVITARALAPLERLLLQAERFMAPETVCLFLKGENASDELTAAEKGWKMKTVETASITHDQARILTLTEVSRVV